LIPLTYLWALNKEQILILSVIITICFITADILRMNFTLAEKYFLTICSKLLRQNEIRKGLTGASYLFIGMTITILIFDKQAAVPAMLFLCVADPMAAIFGKNFGKIKIYNKTLAGFLAFSITASVIVISITDYGLTGMGIALLTAAVELLPIGINDNLVIPLVSGTLFSLVG